MQSRTTGLKSEGVCECVHRRVSVGLSVCVLANMSVRTSGILTQRWPVPNFMTVEERSKVTLMYLRACGACS